MPESPNSSDHSSQLAETAGGATFAPTVFDPEKYRHLVDDDTLTEDQQRELLEIIWKIVAAFVDMGFGVEETKQDIA
ncbi:MAG: hypothetical protein KDJ29_21205, partial [Hyphomicrobiales bacterium]|nr:hypothetical protein [Hyphomicrobiales bacterium]